MDKTRRLFLKYSLFLCFLGTLSCTTIEGRYQRIDNLSVEEIKKFKLKQGFCVQILPNDKPTMEISFYLTDRQKLYKWTQQRVREEVVRYVESYLCRENDKGIYAPLNTNPTSKYDNIHMLFIFFENEIEYIGEIGFICILKDGFIEYYYDQLAKGCHLYNIGCTVHNPELFFEKYKTYWQRNPIYKLSQDNLVIIKESYENAVKLTKESK
jgi:hypothetical protein